MEKTEIKIDLSFLILKILSFNEPFWLGNLEFLQKKIPNILCDSIAKRRKFLWSFLLEIK